MPLITLVGKNSNSFSTFFVSNALMIAILPSYTVGRLLGQTFLAPVIEIIGGRNLHQEAELDRSFFEQCPEIVGKRIWSTPRARGRSSAVRLRRRLSFWRSRYEDKLS